VLGPLEFERGGVSVDLGSAKQRSLLALLLINANQIVSTDRILEELWGDEGSGRQNALWVHVSNLRSALEPDRGQRSEGTLLLTRPPGYMLRVERERTDVGRFERLAAEGRGLLGADPAAAALVLAEALAQWRGKVLEEFTYEPFAQAEIARLESLRLDVVESRVEADLARGLSHHLVGELQGLVREHPLRERFTALLMMALYRSQRQAEALRAYGQLRGVLASELGIEPSEALRDLEEQVLTGDPRLEPMPTAWVPGAPEPGLAVRGYELREKVGEGRYGSVYRAFQPSIGREVAIKVIRSDLANDPHFIRRFEAEASLMAGLERTSAAPLYDFWREPDSAFIVEKLFTGGDLSTVVERGPIPADRAVDLIIQVASTLSVAHGLGVVHGAMKLENILLDSDGGPHLTDFGLGGLRPEDSVIDDVAGLALVGGQLLAGLRTERAGLQGRLEPSVMEVITAAFDGRYSQVEDMVEAFTAASGTTVADRPMQVSNPYKGLEAFSESDTGRFFGRQRLVERMLARLGGARSVNCLLAVVGPSGSGKSSVVGAGLVPALRAGAVPGSESWFIASMSPGVHPFESLERALISVASKAPPLLIEQMMVDPSGLRRAVGNIVPGPSTPLVLIVDQFEEIYTLASEDERDRFVSAIVAAITHERSRIRVVLTLRADFYDRPLATPVLGELMREHAELITPMTPAELEEAITRPAADLGVVVQPALLAALVAEASSRPGGLPLLQYTLTELFDRRQGAAMTTASYQTMGGMAGAVAMRAEALYGALSPEARESARHVFLRLISINDDGEDTRRRVLLAEVLALEGSEDLDDMLRSCARHRLLTFDRDPASRGPTVEIAHEALIRSWARLGRWIDEARTELRAQRALSAAAAEWAAEDKDQDFLLGGASLARYAGWDSHGLVRLTSDERSFLEASSQREHERVEAARSEKLRAAQLRSRTRALGLVAAVGVLFVLLALYAFKQQQTAQRLAEELSGVSLARQLAADSERSLKRDNDLAVLLAIEAIRATEASGKALPEAVDALHWALQEATVPYPVPDADLEVAVRSSPFGPRGVYVLPVDELIDRGRQLAGRELSADECAQYLQTEVCPQSEGPETMEVEGGTLAYTGLTPPEGSLAGTRVVVTAVWSGDEGQPAAASFEALGEQYGIDVVYNSAGFDQQPADVASSDNPGDIVVLSQPGTMQSLAAERPLVDIGAYLGEDHLRVAYGDYLTDLGTAGGKINGVFIKSASKSLLWFNQTAFDRGGYAPPDTWTDLLALSDRMVADGRTPWCLGVSDPFGATGWPATDWLEDAVLSSQGPEFYDRWSEHGVRFDDPAVVAALEQVGLLTHTPGYVAIDSSFIDEWGVDELAYLVSQADPECLMMPGASYIPTWFEDDADMSVVRFPSWGSVGSSIEGGGDMAVALSDRPEVRAIMRGLASAEWGIPWAESGVPFVPAHRQFDLDAFADPGQRTIAALVLRAIDEGTFRFDASDLMPEEIAFDVLHPALTEYVTNPNASAAQTLSGVEAAWSDYEDSAASGSD
jgi:DNA-binding SARP family transcriptional activator/ABC-type glycerol-3-phosphate transport system substrate-binding protein